MQTYIPSLMPTLSRKRDFQSNAACGTIFQVLNTTRPPLNDVRVRYALNMGTDKRAIADFMGVGRNPARSLVPPLPGYRAPAGLPVTIDGVSCDVLDFNPRASRELLTKACGTQPLRIEALSPNLPEAKLCAQLFKKLWRETLGIELTLVTQEVQTWIQSIFSKSYQGVAAFGDYAHYLDPMWFLDSYRSQSAANGTGWTDPKYDAMLAAAEIIPDARGAAGETQRVREISASRHAYRAALCGCLGLHAHAVCSRVWHQSARPAAVQIRLDRYEVEAVMIPRRTLLAAARLHLRHAAEAREAYFRKNRSATARSGSCTCSGQIRPRWIRQNPTTYGRRRSYTGCLRA